ncbi:MAG: hypothetical protein LBK57_03710 [Clostridiales Family XIII bacterium]|jgi:hypothetical protein|nr:hypothetical protein [Clostridiales Family XIII bacterium]
MSEYYKYEAYKKKLQGICDENNLIFRFQRDAYPITLTICPNAGMSEQTGMEGIIGEDDHSSPDAAIEFAYDGGVLTYKTSETFVIDDALFSKIKNLYKNMHAMWLQFFFREIFKKITSGALSMEDFPTDDREPLEDSYENGADGDDGEDDHEQGDDGDGDDAEA